MKDLKKTWSRLFRADRDELLERFRQEIAKRTDGLLQLAGHDFSAADFAAQPAQGKFFFDSRTVPALLDLLRQRLPGEVKNTLAHADKICRHRFDLLGYEDLDYGPQIDWHLDLVHGKQAPRKLFYKVRYLDFEQVGDSKVTWELNRHQHLVTLAKAYRLTEDRRYADEIISQWRHWQRENPYPVGINWASSLEVAFRSLSWFWTYCILDGTPALPADFRHEWLMAQALNGRHIERYLSTYFSPNTHLLGEAVALFFLGTLCPELKAAGRWQALGWQILLREAGRQVQADGMHFEQSVYYHVYALDLFLHATVLATRNGISIPKELEESLIRMLDALALFGRSGPTPNIGDDDGGRLFDARRNHAEHLLDPLATGAVLFGRGDFKFMVQNLREDTIWLLGADGVREWDSIEPSAPAADSRSLPSAGLHFITTEEQRAQLIIDAGPQGAHTAGHGHADALSVWLQAGGRSLLIDSGTGQYVEADRARFRTSSFHNTLTVDQLSQSEPAGPFSWQRLTQARTEKWINGKSFDYFVGSHDGYTRLDDPVVHRRSVFSLKSGLFLIRDEALGRGRHRLDINWHLHPNLSQHSNSLRFPNTDDGIAILPAQSNRWEHSAQKAELSPVYGKKEYLCNLNFHSVADLPATFATMLVPLQPADAGAGVFTQLGTEAHSGVQVYCYRDQADEYLFIFSTRTSAWQYDRVASDAEVVCWKRTDGSDGYTLILCEGSFVEIGGRPILRCSHRVNFCETLVSNGMQETSCSEPDAVGPMERLESPVLLGRGTEQQQ